MRLHLRGAARLGWVLVRGNAARPAPDGAALLSLAPRGRGHDCAPAGTALEPVAAAAYRPGMAETSSEAPVLAGWHEGLARSKAQVAAGRSVPLLPVLNRLRPPAERPEVEQGVAVDGVEATAGG